MLIVAERFESKKPATRRVYMYTGCPEIKRQHFKEIFYRKNKTNILKFLNIFKII